MTIGNERNAEEEVGTLPFPVREMNSSSSEQITGIKRPVEHLQQKELRNAGKKCKQLDSPVKPKEPLPYQGEDVKKRHGFDPPPEPKDLPTNQKECGNEANSLGPTPEPKEQQALQNEKGEPEDVPMMYQKEDGKKANGLDPPVVMEESNKTTALNPTAIPKNVPLMYQKEDGNEVIGLDPPAEMEECNKAIALDPPAGSKDVPLMYQREDGNEVNGLDHPAEPRESSSAKPTEPSPCQMEDANGLDVSSQNHVPSFI